MQALFFRQKVAKIGSAREFASEDLAFFICASTALREISIEAGEYHVSVLIFFCHKDVHVDQVNTVIPC